MDCIVQRRDREREEERAKKMKEDEYEIYLKKGTHQPTFEAVAVRMYVNSNVCC